MVSKLNSQLIRGIAGSLILLVALPSFESLAQETGEPRAGMNFRASPNGRQIGGIPKGENLTILSRKNGWLQVKRSNGKVGWVWAKYITIHSAPTTSAQAATQDTPSLTSTQGELVNVKNSLNIRQRPSSSSRRTGALTPTDSFEIIGEASNGWYRVRTASGVEGYASHNYIRSKPTTSPAPEIVAAAQAPQIERSPTAVVGELVGVKNYLNVQKTASNRSSEVAQLRPNDYFQIMGPAKNGWLKVRTANGTEGFVSERFAQAAPEKKVIRPEHALDQIAEGLQIASTSPTSPEDAALEAECKDNGCFRTFTNANGEVREVWQFSEKLLDQMSKEQKNNPNRSAIVTAQCRISSLYGMRRHPILGYKRMHAGVDVAPLPRGTKVPMRAPMAGKVTKVDRTRGYGHRVFVQLTNGYTVVYNHMDKKSPLRVGAAVKPGDVVGTMGTTGLSTGVHLHLEVLNPRNAKVNPLSIFSRKDLCASA